MEHSYWYKQNKNPLFPEIIWSKPENKFNAGKLLIVGGNSSGFTAPAEAFNIAIKSGIGLVKVILPDQIKKQLGKTSKLSLEMIFVPSTPSGSFATKALAELIDNSIWADGVLLAGDLGHNSETAILLEKFITKYNRTLLLTKDSVDYFVENPHQLINREKTCLVLTIAQLQKIAVKIKYQTPFKFSMNTIQIVEALHKFTLAYPICIILKHLNIVYVAFEGNVSTTESNTDELEVWRLPTASKAIVWWIQNPDKTFESITTSIL